MLQLYLPPHEFVRPLKCCSLLGETENYGHEVTVSDIAFIQISVKVGHVIQNLKFVDKQTGIFYAVL